MDALKYASDGGHRRRRGVLLLVVLSVLTLFLMLGVAYLSITSRAHKWAHAFATNTAAGTAEIQLMDAAFMAVARGTTATLTSGTALASGEDLLGDKYGHNSAITGRITGASLVVSSSGTTKSLIQLTTAGLAATTTGSSSLPANVSDLNGRVLTLLLPGLCTSTRILQASGSATAPTVIIAAGPTASGQTLSQSVLSGAVAAVSGTQPTLVINGREFSGDPAPSSLDTNEPWDGFDARNPLLTRILSGTIPSVTPAPLNSGVPTIDNDGDGVADSLFLDIGLPPLVDASGRTVYPRAAVLVVDLDGRMNVNAHGTNTDIENLGLYPTLSSGTVSADNPPLEQLPQGAPGGPSGVNLVRGLVFGSATMSTSTMLQQVTRFSAGRTQPSSDEADALSSRKTPQIGSVEGRYGDTVWNTTTWTGTSAVTLPSQPGVVGLNDYPGAFSDQWRASLATAGTDKDRAFSYFVSPGRFGAPGDLHGTMRVWVDGFGQPIYYKPIWYQASGFNDVVDDPYEVNLTRRGARTGYSATPSGAATPDDNLFGPADLEGLLRYWDPDSLRLGRRLVVLSGTDASRNRLALTTESWDTPAIPGTHWKTVVGGTFASFISTSITTTGSNRPQDLFAPEVLLGHRMDINRPFHDTLTTEPNDTTGNNATAPLGRRQIFARQLYCLMVSIARANTSGTLSASDARKIAQYAINVVDFRDEDSVMTQFFFDANFGPASTTWSPGSGDFVWGCERPELLITETLAWHNRRTDDLSEGNKITDSSNPDNDLDQSRRPWGAFFVELYSPWKSQAKQLVSGTVGNVTLSPSGTARGEPVPSELIVGGTSSFSTNTTISLSLTTGTSSSNPEPTPVWRLVSVRGNVEGGTAFDAQGKFVDPAAANSTAKIERAFYFAKPPAALRVISGTGIAGVYWTTMAATVEPSQSQYVVAGPENLIFDFHDTQPNPKGSENGSDSYSNNLPAGAATQELAYINKVPLRFNASASISGRTAPTLSEPTAFDGSEPYEVVAKLAYGSNNKFTPDFNAEPHWYDDSKNPISLQHAVDSPLDGYFLNGNTAVSPQFFVKGTGTTSAATPLLMLNGTHDNFAVVHLQRLANPTIAWNTSTNPYITVDSMTVDLTVINTMNAANNGVANPPTGYTQANVDDPSFASQRNYRFRSAERGGKWTDVPSASTPECDIWSGRVRADANPLPSLVMTASNSSPVRSATPLITTPTKKLTAAPGFGTTADKLRGTLREFTRDSTGQPLTGLPSRFYASGGSETSTPRFPWLCFFNRPFNTMYELALVPVGSPTELLQSHSVVGSPAPTSPFSHLPGFLEDATPAAPWNAVTGRSATNAASLFDFLHVPSPFAGIYNTVFSGTANATQQANRGGLAKLGLDVLPLNQLSDYREPGRVNVNTITDARTWRALFGGLKAQEDADVVAPNFFDALPKWDKDQLGISVLQSPGDLFLSMPAAGSSQLLATKRNGGYRDAFVSEDANGNGSLDASEDGNGNGSLDLNNHRNTDRHASFRYQTMNQLSGVVTVRSNVFAVWVTIGYFSDAAGTNEITPFQRNRGFYIFDRSIPVAYERGRDHNVRDGLLLRRIIE